MQRVRHFLQTGIFLLLVVVLGIVCMYKYGRFKLTNETDYNEWAADLGSRLETDIASSFYQKFQFVNLNGAVRSVIGQREMNNVQKLNNGKLKMYHMPADQEGIDHCAFQMSRISSFLTARGIPFIYMIPPHSISKYDPQLPSGTFDYANDNGDRFVEAYRAYGYDVWDLRDMMYEEGIDHYSMVYRTDHHWTTQAGLYTAQKVIPYFAEVLQCDYDSRVLDPGNYMIETYEAQHLGSYGQRTGLYYAGIDDFTVYLPMFETAVECPERGMNGSLVGAFINMEPLMTKDYTNRYTYDYVLGGGSAVAECTYINHLSLNDKKILIVGDSFYRTIIPFMMLSFQEVHYVHRNDSYVLTAEYLERYDAVLFLYGVDTVLGGAASYQFPYYE